MIVTELDVALARRTSRRAAVDVAVFSAEVDAAFAAFERDVAYAVQMARSAVTIGRKRKHWQQRRDELSVSA